MLWDGVADLSGKAFNPSHMRNNFLIFAVCSTKSPKANPARTTGSTNRDKTSTPYSTEQKGDRMICDLWQNVTDSVHYMRFVNTNAKYHLVKPREKFLQQEERENKRMYLEAYPQQHRHFSPIVALVDGFLVP